MEPPSPEKKIKPNPIPDDQRKLAPLTNPQISKTELLEHYKQLINYKQNHIKLQTLIDLEVDPEPLQELKQMNEDLVEAIEAQEEKIRNLQNNDYFMYSVEVLRENMVQRLAKSYFEKDNKWYHAIILNVNEDDQEAELQFIGYKDVLKMHAIFIKLMTAPDPEVFQPGFTCEAIYSDDGSYYPCMIEKITEDNKYVIKFKKYGNKETKTFDDLTTFKIPDHLKTLPNDSELDREKKKKKIKALKQSFKQAQIEKDQLEKQSTWNKFQTHKKAASKFSKGSIFSSPDTIEGKVGVTGSGHGMSNFSVRNKMQLEDNSHLSRMF